MIEPTETESKETLDQFIEALNAIAHEAKHTPDLVRRAPQRLAVERLDEVKAAREPNLRWTVQDTLACTSSPRAHLPAGENHDVHDRS
ncbi:MAG: hypothetical protein HYZ91_03355 [Candidatus Omnitrophica bacterium]|nr:hypothetical protein [Candidatus Omnitrophota bacterium]